MAGHLVKALKAQLRELQGELRTKDAKMAELGGSAKNARLKELEVRCKMSEAELLRQKELWRLAQQEREGRSARCSRRTPTTSRKRSA